MNKTSSLLDLTIAIPAKNEGRILKKCLESIGHGFAQEVVLIDSGSEDDSPAIAESWGAKVIQFNWNGKFPKKRNWYLREHTPATRWILFLDADELLLPAFKTELAKALQREDYVGYWLTYSRYFLGKKLKGGYPLRKLALFQVGAGEYERIEEDHWSRLDMEVHEHPVLSGRVGLIRSEIDHLDLRPIHHYVVKHNEYSSWEAKRTLMLLTQGTTESLTRNQKLKYSLMQTPWLALIYFFGSFFMMGGFRDGYRGLAFSILKMSYFIQIFCKMHEIKDSQRISD